MERHTASRCPRYPRKRQKCHCVQAKQIAWNYSCVCDLGQAPYCRRPQFPHCQMNPRGWERICECRRSLGSVWQPGGLSHQSRPLSAPGSTARHPLSHFPPCVVTGVIVSHDLVGTLKLGHTHIRSLISFLRTSPGLPQRWQRWWWGYWVWVRAFLLRLD